MTVSTSIARAGPYAGSGTTGPFTVPFRFLENSHLRVIRTSTAGVDADLVLTTDYTVAGAGGASGSVTLVTALAVGEKLTILRNVPATQEADYVANDAFPAESHETALDKLTMLVQQGAEEIARSLRLPATAASASTVLPSPASNQVIAWNDTATGLQNLNPAELATIVAFGTAQADQFVGDGTTTQFTLSFEPGTLANLDVSVDGATYVPGVDYTWVSGLVLTFTVAPGVGQEILARYVRALPQGSADGAAVSYVPAAPGAVTNVQARLREHDAQLLGLGRKNHLWQGFFSTWQAGHALTVQTTQRRMICDGVTFARIGLASGVTVLHINGTHRQDAVRIQRDSGNASTASATMVLNLTQEESKPLIGKTVCLQFHASKSSTWTASQITAALQYSAEPEQPILNADGTYTNGNMVAGSQAFTLADAAPGRDSPQYLTATIPSTAIQVSVVVTVPWSGTAGAFDFIDIEGLFVTEGSLPSRVIEESFPELLQKARTRYQASYPYGAPRGTASEQGAVSAVAASTATSWAFAIDVRFNPPMAGVPQFIFQSPLSGTESRLSDTVAGTTINGLAHNLSNTGATITNNAATTDGRRYLCHWTAQYIF